MIIPLDDLARRLRAASRVTVLTGAGVSAASGVPTFRGAGGLWRSFTAEELASPDAFARDPALVWEWYEWRRGQIAACAPNAAHHVLARWTARWPGATVITQNVDDLHLRANADHSASDVTHGGPGGRSAQSHSGPDEGLRTERVRHESARRRSPRLIRLHGSIWELQCWQRCGVEPWRDERVPLPPTPTCSTCGSLARPGVVWFGEMLAPEHLSAAVRACECDVFIMAGTSAVVHPAAGLVHRAHAHGAFTAEINVEVTPVSADVDLVLRGAAEEVLPQLDARLQHSHP